MNCTARALPLLLAVVAAHLAAGPAAAQSLPSQPVPVAPPPTVTPGPATPPPTGLTPPPAPSPPDSAAPPVYCDPLPNHDALLDAPTAPPGWFVAAEVSFLKPHVNNSLTGAVSFGSLGADTVQLPGARLDWVGAPRFELGYRFADDCGAVLVSYRTLSTDGRADLLNFDAQGDGFLRSRLDMDVFDFDYATPTFSPARNVDVRARVGVRLADVFFDSQAVGQVLEQRVSNHFIGAGPHAGLDLWYHCAVPGLALFVRADGALPIGRVRQGFGETILFDDGSVIGSAATQSATRAVPTLNAQIGVGWHPLGTRLRLSAGYEFEYWWDLGHAGASRAELFDHGGFFRAEFNF
jgi:hypothetical protein